MRLDTDHRALTLVAAIVFFILTLTVAILPAFDIQTVEPHPDFEAPTPAVARGRVLYLNEGCGYCHTQFVRDLPMDKPYGRGSVAADYAEESPPLLGSERTGPDLANVGARQSSETWNLIHLYNPRAVAPHSVMPGYPWYFELKDKAGADDVIVPIPERYAPDDGKVVVATDDAIALVRYIQSLTQPELTE